MVGTYKNFLIVNRADIVVDAINLTKTVGAWFNDDNRIWHVKNPADKIILVYDNRINPTEQVYEYTAERKNEIVLGKCIGYIQLYVVGNNSHIKVNKYEFMANLINTQIWEMFKQYITAINVGELTLYWERKLCNRNFQTQIESLGLLTDRHKLTCVLNRQLWKFPN